MSPSSLESQIAEHSDTQQSEMHDHDSFGKLAMSSADFSGVSIFPTGVQPLKLEKLR